MKRLFVWLMAVTLMVAPGCGILEEVNQGVSFATETTEYMNSLTEFGQEMNGMAEQALTDLTAQANLVERLEQLKEQIVNYDALQVPDYAKDLHASIVSYNEQLQQGIDQALANIEAGKAAFESTGIPDTVSQINELLDQLNSLAP
ncbi:hypothetical protein D3P08_09855 [Paenibacillus nanensis]|uniref:Uncharacterized protein n=1 Tax=Paenibacillus nanensis TaxID=393251 RepID=A0A3A1V521_9BACL|nr:DUF6376 family protein [Paenibacillus nanensis]RIX53713.1 hypothetical protein D3P08_09855 [Paenibacillus nanensis]